MPLPTVIEVLLRNSKANKMQLCSSMIAQRNVQRKKKCFDAFKVAAFFLLCSLKLNLQSLQVSLCMGVGRSLVRCLNAMF
jgi:hypothetical protein